MGGKVFAIFQVTVFLFLLFQSHHKMAVSFFTFDSLCAIRLQFFSTSFSRDAVACAPFSPGCAVFLCSDDVFAITFYCHSFTLHSVSCNVIKLQLKLSSCDSRVNFVIVHAHAVLFVRT